MMASIAAFEEYFDFLDELADKLEELTEIAKEKTLAVRRDDLESVNECMKREQALSLALRTMDTKRERMLEQLGLAGVKLSGLPEHCPPELRQEANEVVEDLREQYELYRSAAEIARTTLEVNLHQIEKMIADEGDLPPSDGSVADIRA